MNEKIKSKYTAEQLARFDELYQKLVEADKQVEDYKTEPHLQHRVLKRRFVLITLGEHLHNYDKEVPEDIKEAFNFDEESLIEKVKVLSI